MLKIALELQEELTVTMSIVKELCDEKVREEFKVGKYSTNIKYASDEVITTMVSILHTRVAGTHFLRDEGLFDKANAELEEFRDSYTHFRLLKEFKENIKVLKAKYDEVEALLTQEEKRQIYLIKYNKG